MATGRADIVGFGFGGSDYVSLARPGGGFPRWARLRSGLPSSAQLSAVEAGRAKEHSRANWPT